MLGQFSQHLEGKNCVFWGNKKVPFIKIQSNFVVIVYKNPVEQGENILKAPIANGGGSKNVWFWVLTSFYLFIYLFIFIYYTFGCCRLYCTL